MWPITKTSIIPISSDHTAFLIIGRLEQEEQHGLALAEHRRSITLASAFRQPLLKPRSVGRAQRRMERPAIVDVAIVVRTSIHRFDERLEG